jgi:hypothetical protein
MLYCPHVFAQGSLHLVLWDRLDDATHVTGLDLIRDLLARTDLHGEVMLLLRPAPRTDRQGRPDPLYFQEQFGDPDLPLV